MRIGIDIGGSHVSIGIVNEDGEILKKIEQDILDDKCNENIENFIVSYVDYAVEKLSENKEIEHIGIAAPGNPNGKIIYDLVNLGIKQLDFSVLEEKYNIKIKSINDAKAAALAEKKYGSMQEYVDGFFLCLGSGIGGAVFFNNMLLKSNRNPGFEIGHMIIEKDGKPCKCGKKGCFETYCSIKRFKENIVRKLKKIDNNINIKNGEELIKQLRKYNENLEIKEIIEQYIDDLIIGISNIIDIFEPEVICLGGSFVYFKDILYIPLIERMEKERYVFNKENPPKIVLAKLKNDAGLIGAALL